MALFYIDNSYTKFEDLYEMVKNGTISKERFVSLIEDWGQSQYEEGCDNGPIGAEY